MKKILVTAVLTYDDETMHGNDPDAERWFFRLLLDPEDRLLLHSNELGDEIGDVRVISSLHLSSPTKGAR